MAKKRRGKSKRTVVETQRALAAHFGVSPKTISEWKVRGMPGTPGKYCVEDINKWREDTFRRSPEHDIRRAVVAQNASASMNDNRARLLAAQADREEANAKIAQYEAALKEGNYADLDNVNLFVSEFLTETRRLLSRVPVEMAPGYPAKIRKQMRQDLDRRIALVLDQMHDWLLRVEELRTES